MKKLLVMLLSLLMTMVMAFTLTACGEDETGEGGTPTTSPHDYYESYDGPDYGAHYGSFYRPDHRAHYGPFHRSDHRAYDRPFHRS